MTDRPYVPAALTVGFVGSLGRACFSDLVLRTVPSLEAAYRVGSRKGLLTALAHGTLDVAVYPGAAVAGQSSRHLCDDRVVAAARAGETGASSWTVARLATASLAIPAEDDGGDFRRIVQTMLPGLNLPTEMPMRALVADITGGARVALVATGHGDELNEGIALHDLDADTRFPIQLAWRAPVRAAIDALIAALS